METTEAIALILGASWASGINLYAAILVLGWLGISGQVDLPPDLMVLTHPMVLGAAGVMYAIEFFADKTPGVDTGWDALHTFIRIPAGALMAAGAAQGLDLGQAAELVALLVGGSVSATTHVTKASSRALINTSPEPFSNWTASVTEDVSVIAGLWTALHYPVVFIVLFVLFILAVIWLLPRLWRALRRLVRAIGRWFGNPAASPTDTSGTRPSAAQPAPDGLSRRRRAVLKELYDDAGGETQR